MPRKSKTELVDEVLDIVHGLKGKLAKVDEFVLDDRTYTNQELVAEFQRLPAAILETRNAHAAWRQAVKDEKTVRGQIGNLRNRYKSLVDARYGASTGKKGEAGIHVSEPKEPDAQTKAEAAKKRAEIRAAKKAAEESVTGKTKKK